MRDAKNAIANFTTAVLNDPTFGHATFRLANGNVEGGRQDLENAKAAADEATAKRIAEMIKALACQSSTGPFLFPRKRGKMKRVAT
jgi:hypothetical protein